METQNGSLSLFLLPRCSVGSGAVAEGRWVSVNEDEEEGQRWRSEGVGEWGRWMTAAVS